MSIFIPLLISFYLYIKIKDSKTVQITFFSITLLLFVLILLFTSKKDNIIRFIPFTEIDNSRVVRVQNKGKCYLTKGVDLQLSGSFELDVNSNYTEVSDYISDSSKNLYMIIKNNGNIVYSYEFGKSNEQDAINIMSIYYTWYTSAFLPRNKIRYKFLIFFLDV